MSGIIFAVLAAAWALYLIPKMLKHHDEIARTRSIDRFSTAMRVLARREPVNRRDTRLVVTPARPSGIPRVLLPEPAASEVAEVTAGSQASSPGKPVRRPAAARTAARAAARRRRRILIIALFSLGITAGGAGFGYVPLWFLAAPVALTFSYLCLCRRQVRRAQEASWIPPVEPAAPRISDAAPAANVAARPAIRVDTSYGTPLAQPPRYQEASLDGAAVADAVPTTGAGSLWDPLPVTLPTYVSKARAPRTVRTIDLLGEPGAWTSGRSDAHSHRAERPVEETPSSAEEEASFEQGEQHAVGS